MFDTCGHDIMVNITLIQNLDDATLGHNQELPLTPYDPGGGALKAPPPPIFCPHAFNFGATILCVGDFFQKMKFLDWWS